MSRQIDFLIAGAQKAGTSSLKAYLQQHPQIRMHDQEEITCFVVDQEYRRGLEKVLDGYYPGKFIDQQLLAGKSAGIMCSERALARVAEHNPRMKLLVLLRNPVERAYSAYCFLRRKGREPLGSFSAALAAEEGRLAQGGDLAWYCGYRERGQYARQLQSIYEFFPRDQVRVELFDELKENPQAVCHRIFDWLGVDDGFEPACGTTYNPAGVARSQMAARLLVAPNSPLKWFKSCLPKGLGRSIKERLQQLNSADLRPEPMSPDIRKELVDYFRQPNRELEGMIDRSLEHWNR